MILMRPTRWHVRHLLSRHRRQNSIIDTGIDYLPPISAAPGLAGDYNGQQTPPSLSDAPNYPGVKVAGAMIFPATPIMPAMARPRCIHPHPTPIRWIAPGTARTWPHRAGYGLTPMHYLQGFLRRGHTFAGLSIGPGVAPDATLTPCAFSAAPAPRIWSPKRLTGRLTPMAMAIPPIIWM